MLSLRLLGISDSIIFRLRPSAIAVFPTPGSPISIGLFLVLLDNISIVLLISSSLPITGSISPLAACSVKFRVYFLYIQKYLYLHFFY